MLALFSSFTLNSIILSITSFDLERSKKIVIFVIMLTFLICIVGAIAASYKQIWLKDNYAHYLFSLKEFDKNRNVKEGFKFFGTYLPPMLKNSKSNLEKLSTMIAHPLLKSKSVVNLSSGETIKQNKVNYDFNLSLRSPSEHFPSTRYSNNYNIKNINVLRTTFDNLHSPSFSHWQGDLREYNRNVSKVIIKSKK